MREGIVEEQREEREKEQEMVLKQIIGNKERRDTEIEREEEEKKNYMKVTNLTVS